MPYKVNGMDVTLPEPVVTDGTTYVPVADLANTLGGYADWNHEEKTARIEIGDKVAMFHNDDPIVKVGDLQYDLQATPYIQDGTLWVPVRAFRDVFDIGLVANVTSLELTR